MLVSGLSFVGMNVMVKVSGQGLPAVESAFLRFALGLVFLLPLLPKMWREPPGPLALRLVGLRGIVHAFGVSCWFFAMTRLPLAEVTAMNYLTPICVTLGAAVFLGEKLALRRMLAVAVALAGVLIILRPGVRELGAGHVAMLGTSMGMGASYLIAKRLSDMMNPAIVVAWMSVAVTVALMPLALWNWVWPTPAQVGGLFLVSAFATGGHYAMTRAFTKAPVNVTQPVTFLQIVWAALIGATMFGEPVDFWVLVGAAIIIAAIGYVTWRESRKPRQVTPPDLPDR